MRMVMLGRLGRNPLRVSVEQAHWQKRRGGLTIKRALERVGEHLKALAEELERLLRFLLLLGGLVGVLVGVQLLGFLLVCQLDFRLARNPNSGQRKRAHERLAEESMAGGRQGGWRTRRVADKTSGRQSGWQTRRVADKAGGGHGGV